MKITVGIPFFNAEQFLESSILSVLNQTYDDFELILSNDGSTDHSLSIAKSFNDSRITILSDGRNRGISFRLNEQISIAKGKYFVRMDSDDLMFPTRIEKQISFLESHPDIDVIGSQAIVIDDMNKIIGLRDSILPISLNEILIKPTFIHPTVVGRIEWYRKFGYSNDLKGAEDFDLWIRSFNHSKFHILNEPLIFYRDPLQIKINTYRFRQQQLRKCLWSNRKLFKNKIHLAFVSIKSYLKTIIFRIAIATNLDQLLIVRRNIPLKNDIYLYYNHLINQLLDNHK